ncbi:urease accessory protein UreE [Oceanicoccus sp. KOV_DT_Chl]|uniref:urease accessory protein UreE n=1 Tax=Oceanicoccus sp. KOV_DT_Chl TaxID=1904639 RepID=UPI000C79A9F0|nr:urease accessory protein UreE [Oceanicoccus sp. KOV_DT_Chl]
MKECFELSEQPAGPAALAIELDYQQRQKSRHKAQTVCGETLGWFLERGRVLQHDDVLQCSDGSCVKVIAAAETVSEVCSDDAHLLMRAAYHLGNRHVPLQIGADYIRYQHDHVLDDMVLGLGLTVESCQRPFHPENGAYHGQTKNHDHSHDHAH